MSAPPASAVPPTSETAAPPTGVGRALGQLVLRAIPPIASAVGFVGFVAVLGAAIEWVRFSSAGLPADQAVRVAARPELVATGAVSLIAFTIVGLLAVMVAYLADPRAEGTTLLAAWTAGLAFLEAVAVLAYMATSWSDRGPLLGIVVACGFMAGMASVKAAHLHRGPFRKALADLRDSHVALRRALEMTAGRTSTGGDQSDDLSRAYHRLKTAVADSRAALDAGNQPRLGPVILTAAPPDEAKLQAVQTEALAVAPEVEGQLGVRSLSQRWSSFKKSWGPWLVIGLLILGIVTWRSASSP
jgi:hypothetical protein